jgi:anti-anti-sigma regulatory factor
MNHTPDPQSLAIGSVEDGNLIVTILAPQVREAAVAYRLRDEIIQLIDQANPANLVLDLSKATFIGSVGFLSFLGLRRHFASGRIVLANLPHPIREMFAVCRLIATELNPTAPFEIAASKEAALTRLST